MARRAVPQVAGGPGPFPSAWYSYPHTTDYGGPEPYGNFPKPDENFFLPANTPITALSPGTVTAVDNPAWGGAVTMQMDQPYNPIATHQAYIHLARSTASVGQHLNAGDLLGYGGANITSGQQPAGVGFAFYNGSDYGFGPSWSKYVGTPPLNPDAFLNSVSQNGPGNPPGGPSPWCLYAPWLPGCTPAGTPSLFDPCTWPIVQWFCPGSTVNWQDVGIRILLVVVGAILVIVGFSKVFGGPTTPPPEDDNHTATGLPGQGKDKGEGEDEGEGEGEQGSEAAESGEASEAAEAAAVA